MTTIAKGNTAQIYCADDAQITFTPGSGGSIRFDCSSPDIEGRPVGRVIYSLVTIPIPAGSRVFAEAVGSDAEYEYVGVNTRATLLRSAGAYFPKKLARASLGKKLASWGSALQNSAGTTSFVTTDLPPWSDNATRVLRLDQGSTPPFGQQSPPDGSQAYLPRGGTTGFSMGLWVKNPNSRTLNFMLQVYNTGASKNIRWNAAVEPASNYPSTNGWVFLTFNTNNALSGGSWTLGTDVINYVRVGQQWNGSTEGNEGAWVSGEYLLFGNVYCDVIGRPRFLFTFDDGLYSQRYPGGTAKVSGSAYVSSSTTNVFTTAAAHALQAGEPLVFTSAAPTSLSVGTVYYVGTTSLTSTTFTLYTDSALSSQATSTGFSGNAPYQYGGSQERSCQQIVESYGFRGSLFIVPGWLGSTGKYGVGTSTSVTPITLQYLAATDVQAMYNEGWAIGSHSNTHPSNGENAGLRLLGPYGYYLSDYSQLSSKYQTNWSLSQKRRVTAGTQASPSVFTTENAHKFATNQPIVFTDVAPTGCTLGVTYYVSSIPSTTTFTLATDQGTLASGVNNTTGAWSGTANYRYPGSAPDDSAIYADVMAGIAGVAALGISTGATFFALPQGSADEYVRSALIRSGIKWVRGIGSQATGFTTGGIRTFTVGAPSGSGLSQIQDPPGGWLAQPDAVQTDGAGSPTIPTIKAYMDDVINMGSCGCCYHHALSTTTLAGLDQACAYARTKVDAGLLDVITLDELGKILQIT